MHDFKLKIKYQVNKQNYETDRLETAHFSIKPEVHDDRLKMIICPFAPIMIDSFSITMPCAFDKDSRVFVNGYQTWTDSKEYLIHEKMTMLHPLTRGIIKNSSKLNRYGDYLFYEPSKEKGVFYGYSYSYVRLGERFDLYASLNERSGYTIFELDANDSAVTVIKDVDGVVFDSEYEIMDIVHLAGDENTVFDKYFDLQEIEPIKKELKSGYTTWYNYYQNINEDIVYRDLGALSKLKHKADIFQIDDGYQNAIGDWLITDKKKFPNGMKNIADKIHEKGFTAGLWLAPFAGVKKSKLMKEHPDWFIRDEEGKFCCAGGNWGGFYALDFYNKEAASYIRNVFDTILNTWGYDMVKLDFLYEVCMLPIHGKSRGQIMSEAMDFLRECVGDKLILGCGVPLAPAFGKVDFCRIGPDMALDWKVNKYTHRENVCTPSAMNNTIFRRQLDGRAFLNDPDVFLLRDDNIHMDFERRKIIAKINHIFGNLLFVSDNVSRYNKEQEKAFYDAISREKENVISAEYESENILKIVCDDSSLRFDIRNGKFI